jgi:hypothetical protein
MSVVQRGSPTLGPEWNPVGISEVSTTRYPDEFIRRICLSCQEVCGKLLENQKYIGNFLKSRFFPLVELQCLGPRSVEKIPPVN